MERKLSKEEKRKKAIKEEERLDILIEEYFKNGLNPTPQIDEVGLDLGMTEPVDTKKVEEEEEVSADGKVREEENEEEVYLLHNNGQITSEIEESDNNSFDIGYATPRQTIIEKAIYNKAIKNTYKLIEKYQDTLINLNKNNNLGSLERLFEEDLNKTLSNLRSYRSELNTTGFSQYADIPKETIDLFKIETKELRKIIDLEIEKITVSIINGGM